MPFKRLGELQIGNYTVEPEKAEAFSLSIRTDVIVTGKE
jgi:hypothetical protein